MLELWYGFLDRQTRKRNHRKEMRINRAVA